MTYIIIGAGLAGLSCALTALDAGHAVEIHEAAPQAGGRCRSWHDNLLGAVVDNGTHLLAGGNSHGWAYLRRIGAEHSMLPLPASLPMADVANGKQWSVSPWRLAPTIAASLFRLKDLDGATVEQALGQSSHYRDFWHPLALAALNTDPSIAQARLLRHVARRTLWRGAAASRLFRPRFSLHDSFIAPALHCLNTMGVSVRFTHSLRRIENGTLIFDDGCRPLSQQDRVILALPPHSARRFCPDLPILPSSDIANIHIRTNWRPPALGVIGGTAQWLSTRDPHGDQGEGLLSVTISAAQGTAETLLAAVREDLLRLGGPDIRTQPHRIVRERRATLLHTPDCERLRRQLSAPVALAGDWTVSDLPNTMESAILSGIRAVQNG